MRQHPATFLPLLPRLTPPLLLLHLHLTSLVCRPSISNGVLPPDRCARCLANGVHTACHSTSTLQSMMAMQSSQWRRSPSTGVFTSPGFCLPRKMLSWTAPALLDWNSLFTGASRGLEQQANSWVALNCWLCADGALSCLLLLPAPVRAVLMPACGKPCTQP